MAIPHAQPGEVVSVRPLGAALANQISHTLVKTNQLELIRLVLAQGKEIATHKVAGPIIVLCLEGRVTFQAMGKTLALEAGELLHLPAHEPHSVHAQEPSSLLVTILMPTT